MLGILENVVVTSVLQWLFSGVLTLTKGAWAFGWAHPLLAAYVFFGLFCLTFLAYGTLRRMYDDGTWAGLRASHKALLVFFLWPFFLLGYLYDIGIMRCMYGWARFGIAPPFREWRRPLGAAWTFSHLIWALKGSNAEALWWHEILHAIDPKGH
jgi:hypothetical protein